VKVDVIVLRVPARPEYLALVRMVVAGTARIDPLLDDERVDDLRVIVSEACTNAIEATHSRGDGQEASDLDSIQVECRLTASQVEVIVVDGGRGFDPGHLGRLPPITDPSRLRIERGLGIPLIRALADESSISSGPDGTRVQAVLQVAPRPPTDAA